MSKRVSSLKYTFVYGGENLPDGVHDYVANLLRFLSNKDLVINTIEKGKEIHTLSSDDQIVFSFPYRCRKSYFLSDIYILITSMIRRLSVILILHEWYGLKLSRRLFLVPWILFSRKIIVPSDEIENQLEKSALGTIFRPNKIHIVPIAPNVNLTLSPTLPKRKNKLVFGLFGLGYPSKNFSIAIDIGVAIAKKNIDVSLVWVGSFLDSQYEKKIRSYLANQPSSPKFKFIEIGHLGSTEQISHAFRDVSFFLALNAGGFDRRHGSTLSLLQTGRKVITLKRADEHNSLGDLPHFSYDYPNMIEIENVSDVEKLIDGQPWPREADLSRVVKREWRDVASEFLKAVNS